jgi:hypothetical protein
MCYAASLARGRRDEWSIPELEPPAIPGRTHVGRNRGAKKIIAQGTDWRFFNELMRELKG